MRSIHASVALLPDGWHPSTRITVGADGFIMNVVPGAPAEADDIRTGILIPGMPNVHSHAFQRGMAGLTETPGPASDSFWTWRHLMYRFAMSITPDQLEAITTWLYIEMLEAGYTHAGEFHYLHHDGDGHNFTDIAEMAGRIIAAAETTGIQLTLLPVFYAHSDFGGAPALPEQRRFITDLDTYSRLLEACRVRAAQMEGVFVGVAPHSLRAVTPEELAELTTLADHGPIHMHIAEQQREVDACIAWSGARPVEWLLDHTDVDERWCLIHATHTTTHDISRLADSGAVVGVCPITEANLGDGVFPARAFLDHGGRLGIGSDSNTRISVPAELAQLEYSQRLSLNARNVLAERAPTGRSLYQAAMDGGQQALGQPSAGIAAGAAANLLALRDALLEDDDGDRVLNRWIFSEGVHVDQVWIRGQLLVRDGVHIAREGVAARFRAAMRELLSHVSM